MDDPLPVATLANWSGSCQISLHKTYFRGQFDLYVIQAEEQLVRTIVEATKVLGYTPLRENQLLVVKHYERL